jgi:hypothetical protein
MSIETDVRIEAINDQMLAYKLNEIDKAAFMTLLTRVAQKCFVLCIDNGVDAKLTSKEKECLNACFNRRSMAREKLVEAIFEDGSHK